MNRPIGVFDSGVGGLTVLKKLKENTPEESFIYLADTKNVPYGTKSGEEIKELSINAYKTLKEYSIKLLVIGCNTATVHGLEAIRSIADVPVIGVVEAGVLSALEKKKENLLLVATDATIKSNYYQKLLEKNNPNLNIQGIGCPDWVYLVERNMANTKESYTKVENILDKSSIKEELIILGCTHFPVLIDDINKYYDKINRDIEIVDPAIKCSTIVKEKLQENEIKIKTNIEGKTKFLCSGNIDRFIDVGSTVLGEPISKEDVIQV